MGGFFGSLHSDRTAGIAAAGDIGLWEWDSERGRFWFSEFARQLLKLQKHATLIDVQKRLFPDDQKEFLDTFTYATGDQPIDVRARVEIRPEYFRWVRWRGASRRPGEDMKIAGTIQDIHDESLTRAELQFTQEMLTEAQRIARLGSWQYDIRSERLFWSEETYAIFGRNVALGPPQGDTLYRYIETADSEKLKARLDTALQSGHPYELDLAAVRDDGHRIMVRMIGRPIFDHAGNPSLVVGTLQDITDWMDLRDAKTEAEENQRTQNQFLASVSHEIRTPMNAVFGMAQLLLLSKLPAQQHEQVRVILSAARDLLAIINDLLDLAKVESGHMAIESIPFDLYETVREAAILHAGRIYAKGLNYIVDISPNVPRMTEGDPLRLKQIISNLIGNAAKFTKEGEISLRITNEGQAAGQHIIRFMVTDTGVGIPPHRLTAVFEKYTQAETSTAREYGGTGLGLAICRELVELMSGTIHVASTEKSGTLFWFDIPMTLHSAPALPHLAMKLIVLEPNPSSAQQLNAQCSQLGVRPVVVAHPDNLLAAYREAANTAPFTHVLIADHPSYDVEKVLAQFRSTGGKPAPRRIFIALPTSIALADDLFDAVLMKPTMTVELARVLSGSGAASDDGTNAPAPTPRRRRVLLAEDDAANRKAMTQLLEACDLDVTVVGDGEGAVACARAQQWDLIILDVQMPGMDGLMATRALCDFWQVTKQLPVPIVALTGNVGADDAETYRQIGMKDILTKPVMLEDLRRIISQYAK